MAGTHMVSNGNQGQIPATGPVQGSHVPITVSTPSASGKSLPPSGKNAAAAAPAGNPAPSTTDSELRSADPHSLVDLLNRYLNDSGRPDQFRVDPASDDKLIQQINPANGEVIGEFAASEFPALARSIGASGLVVDSRA
jgi:hypothetical protein